MAAALPQLSSGSLVYKFITPNLKILPAKLDLFTIKIIYRETIS
jgi:hypothetical protein